MGDAESLVEHCNIAAFHEPFAAEQELELADNVFPSIDFIFGVDLQKARFLNDFIGDFLDH
jgi:hypothetical protein